MSNHLDFVRADSQHIGREKAKAAVLRKSQWWKNQKGKGFCHYCKERIAPQELTMDHIVPIARGGKSQKNNVVPCCKPCNKEKKYLVPVEWKVFQK